jgi:putative transposase
VLDAWAYQAGVRLSFIRPGKPVENAYIESFNGRFRDECLNEHWFLTMVHARRFNIQSKCGVWCVRPRAARAFLA